MSPKKTLSLDEVFAEDLKKESFQKELRLLKPYEELLVEVINLRTERGLTQKQLAEKAGTHQGRISKIESGKHDFRISTIVQIAEALESEVIIRLLPLEVKRGDKFSIDTESKILNKTAVTISDQDSSARTNKEIIIDTGNPLADAVAVEV